MYDQILRGRHSWLLYILKANHFKSKVRHPRRQCMTATPYVVGDILLSMQHEKYSYIPNSIAAFQIAFLHSKQYCYIPNSIAAFQIEFYIPNILYSKQYCYIPNSIPTFQHVLKQLPFEFTRPEIESGRPRRFAMPFRPNFADFKMPKRRNSLAKCLQ